MDDDPSGESIDEPMSESMSESISEEEALRLNTLHRFRKHSPRLLLEEYSHCEVVAGCGGVVLRWVDPHAGIPAIVRSLVPAKLELWLDGAPLDSGHIDLRAGRRTLALELTEIGSHTASRIGRGRPSALLLSIVRSLGRDHRGTPAILLSSLPGPMWRVTSEQPPPDWITPEFDDSRWPEAQRAELDEGQREQWGVRQIQACGAVPIALPADRAWVRVHFEVPEFAREEQP